MLKELTQRFVRDELMPLESKVLEREASGQGIALTPEEKMAAGCELTRPKGWK